MDVFYEVKRKINIEANTNKQVHFKDYETEKIMKIALGDISNK